jgi:predicted negative regulator of RcsB-dependent stress response
MGERGNIVALILLVLIALVMLGGWYLFPYVAHFMQQQDCIATGRVNC